MRDSVLCHTHDVAEYIYVQGVDYHIHVRLAVANIINFSCVLCIQNVYIFNDKRGDVVVARNRRYLLK